jgi:hypothetical protein
VKPLGRSAVRDNATDYVRYDVNDNAEMKPLIVERM